MLDCPKKPEEQDTSQVSPGNFPSHACVSAPSTIGTGQLPGTLEVVPVAVVAEIEVLVAVPVTVVWEVLLVVVLVMV